MTNIHLESSKTIIKNSYVEIKEDSVTLKNGTTAKYHTLYRASAVIVLPLTETNELYCISQYRYLYDKRVLEMVAGYIDPNENSLGAAKRELKEEVGLVANQWEEILRAELAGSSIKGTIHIFLARGLEEVKAKPEAGEDIEVLKMPLEEVVKKAMNGEIHDTSGVAGILLLDKLRREKRI